MNRLTLIAVAVAVASTSCGVAGGPEKYLPAPDWSKPLLPNTERVPSIAAAATRLPFKPRASSAIVAESKIFAMAGPPRKFPGLDLVVDDPHYGRFQVMEQGSDITQAQLEAVGRCDPSEGCDDGWDLVTIRGGIRALLDSGPVTTTIEWLDRGIRFTVEGPSDTLSGDEATAIANTL